MSEDLEAEGKGHLMFDPHSEDPLDRARARCLKINRHVQKYVKILEVCNDRVRSRSNTAETCHQEVMDLMEALDHCAHYKAFLKLV